MPADKFFEQVATEGAYWVDEPLGDEAKQAHGKMTHLLQDLVVNKALGGPRASAEFRQLLHRFIDVCNAIAYAQRILSLKGVKGVLEREPLYRQQLVQAYREAKRYDEARKTVSAWLLESSTDDRFRNAYRSFLLFICADAKDYEEYVRNCRAWLKGPGENPEVRRWLMIGLAKLHKVDEAAAMALEDLAMMRAVFGSTVLYPSDANQAAQLTAQMAAHGGVVYMRTTREKTPVIYTPDEKFSIGGSRVVRQSSKDQATIVAAGITLHEALEAYNQLLSENIVVRVIDAYSIKPIDEETLLAAVEEVGNKIITVEDHWPEGGLGEVAAWEGRPAARRSRSSRARFPRSLPRSGSA
jgi:tetratricopeptide (TPR) repeat protein